MEKIAVKVSRLQKVTAGLAVIAVIAGGVAVVSEIDANNRIAEAFSGTTEVVAATKTIRAGEEISASDLAFVSVPNSTVADGAITKKDIDDSSKTPVGRVATQYIAKGSQLTNASTAGKDNPESLAAAIGDGMEAVTISVDAQSGMGGMLRVNDRVKVIQPNDGSLGGDGFTVIADSVRIAALDGNFSSGSGSSDGYSTVTLEVTPEQAGKIRTAGGLTLTLPSSADTTESGE
ncbi:MAG: Flp pilus assembly protein CpaB [Coprococcus comes]